MRDLDLNKQNTSKSLGRLGEEIDGVGSGYNSQQDQREGGGYMGGYMGGNTSQAMESEIQLIETPFSRAKQVKRMGGG